MNVSNHEPPSMILPILHLGLQITKSLGELDLYSVSERCLEMRNWLESWEQRLSTRIFLSEIEENQLMIERQRLEERIYKLHSEFEDFSTKEQIFIGNKDQLEAREKELQDDIDSFRENIEPARKNVENQEVAKKTNMIAGFGICQGSGLCIGIGLAFLSNPISAAIASSCLVIFGAVSGLIAMNEARKAGNSNIARAKNLHKDIRQEHQRISDQLYSIQKRITENKRKIKEAKREGEKVAQKLLSTTSSLEENRRLRQSVAQLKEQLLQRVLIPCASLNCNRNLQQVAEVTSKYSKMRETSLDLLLSISNDLAESLTDPEIALMFDNATQRKSIKLAQKKLKEAKLALQHSCQFKSLSYRKSTQ